MFFLWIKPNKIKYFPLAWIPCLNWLAFDSKTNLHSLECINFYCILITLAIFMILKKFFSDTWPLFFVIILLHFIYFWVCLWMWIHMSWHTYKEVKGQLAEVGSSSATWVWGWKSSGFGGKHTSHWTILWAHCNFD